MKHNLPFLKHIFDETVFLTEKTKGLSVDGFSEDAVLKRACTRSFEIIGEAVKNLPAEFKNKHTDIDWRRIAGMRDKIIHFYFGVDYDILWKAIKEKIPELKLKIEEIIRKAEE